MRVAVEVDAKKFESLVQAVSNPVIILDADNAYLDVGYVRYATPKRVKS